MQASWQLPRTQSRYASAPHSTVRRIACDHRGAARSKACLAGLLARRFPLSVLIDVRSDSTCVPPPRDLHPVAIEPTRSGHPELRLGIPACDCAGQRVFCIRVSTWQRHGREARVHAFRRTTASASHIQEIDHYTPLFGLDFPAASFHAVMSFLEGFLLSTHTSLASDFGHRSAKVLLGDPHKPAPCVIEARDMDTMPAPLATLLFAVATLGPATSLRADADACFGVCSYALGFCWDRSSVGRLIWLVLDAPPRLAVSYMRARQLLPPSMAGARRDLTLALIDQSWKQTMRIVRRIQQHRAAGAQIVTRYAALLPSRGASFTPAALRAQEHQGGPGA